MASCFLHFCSSVPDSDGSSQLNLFGKALINTPLDVSSTQLLITDFSTKTKAPIHSWHIYIYTRIQTGFPSLIRMYIMLLVKPEDYTFIWRIYTMFSPSLEIIKYQRHKLQPMHQTNSAACPFMAFMIKKVFVILKSWENISKILCHLWNL